MVVSCQEKGQSRGIEGTKGDYGDMEGRRLCVGGEGSSFSAFYLTGLYSALAPKKEPGICVLREAKITLHAYWTATPSATLHGTS